MARQTTKKQRQAPQPEVDDDGDVDMTSTSSSSSSSSSGDEDDSDDQSHHDESDHDESDHDEKESKEDRVTSTQSKHANNENDQDNSDAASNNDSNDSSSSDNEHHKEVTPPPISKSWTTLTTHSPCYTGGTVVVSHSSFASKHDVPSNHPHDESHFILAQRGGDVAIIEASTGLFVRTLRRGAKYQGSRVPGLTGVEGGNGETVDDEEEEEDDEEEVMDAEAITAFALAPNNREVVVVTRGHLVRRYSLVEGGVPAVNDNEDKKKKKDKDNNEHTSVSLPDKPHTHPILSHTHPAPIVQSLGKSGHTLPVTQIAYHPSGIFFATGSVDGLVKVWDQRNGYATHAFYPTSGGKGRHAVTCLRWRPLATCLVLAVGREDGSICIHDLLLLGEGKDGGRGGSLPVAVMRDHVSAVMCVAWSEGGGMESSSSFSSSSSSKKHGGGLFFSSGRDSVINTWLITQEDVVDQQPRRKKKKTRKDGADEQSSSFVQTKVTYVRIRTLPVYEQVQSMVLLPRRFRPLSESKEQQQALDRKDVVLATVGTKGIVRLWRATPTGKEGVHSVSDLTLLASQREDEAFGEEHGGYTSLHLTSLSTTHISPLLVAVDAEHNMTFMRLGWATDGKSNATLRIDTDRSIVGHNGEILDLAVIPTGGQSSSNDTKSMNDKHTIAVATNSSQVRIFGLAEAKDDELGESNDETKEKSHPALSPRGMLDGHTAIVLAIDCSPCGRYLATAGKDKTMRLWHTASRKCIGVATGHTEAVGSVALSNKIGCYDVGGKAAESGAGAFVVTASKDRTLKVWPLPGSAVLNRRVENGEGELELRARLSARAHEKDINIVSVAPNDSLIATGSQDKTVKLWRSTDLALHGTLKGHKRGIWDCQFSHTDRVLATASGDRTVKLWSISDCSCVRTFQGHMAGVLRVRFLATGLQLISSGSDGLIKLWTIRTNECESTIDAHDDKIWALDLSPCGTALFSGGADSKIAVWRDTTKERDDAAREAEEKNILMEQKLSNHLRNKQYEAALEIALKLDKPNQVLRVLTEIVEKDTKSSRGIVTLQKHAVNWALEQLTQILKYCREWNTRARNSNIAMLVVKAVVTTIPSTKLAAMEGIPEILGGIAPYAERHFDRLERMVENSYLLDFTLFSMGSLHGTTDEKYSQWLERSKYVLPPKVADGKVQIGGSLVVGAKKQGNIDSSDDGSDGSVITVGESDSSDDDQSSNSED
ncbi:hypothetical protein HJC23_007215 [Cyclotella cryptica]|uniref:U3 small nucleolar RNA-associated protein 13 C-terminal domain-containing protein n=1 Tax=Cyclotella cryptica TaxID=29204 RepID=A0ABD3QPU2_9STRA|eukprot:CCRYP_003510-RA/>CCRYP_003510-RA protein AED:0.29 eAED:0.29 QI:148/1/1/1/1/1/6/2820/1218